MKIPGSFAMFMAMMMGPPRYRFNRKLFWQLIRKLQNGATIAAPEQEPSVTFKNGPIDGVIGQFNRKTMSIDIDQLEILMACFAESDGSESVAEMKRRFDTKMTRTLAHEGRHWQIEKRHGLLALIERIGINIFLLLMGTLATWVMYIVTIRFAMRWVIPHAWTAHPALGVFAALACTVFFVLVVTQVGRRFLFAWAVVSSIVTYRLCYSERSARAFEDIAEKDPRWGPVIEVD